MHLVSERRGPALGTLAIAVAMAALLWTASAARASETIYWDNYNENSLAYANIDGTGGGQLSLGGVELNNPEGTALDVAGNRLFAASASGGPESEGQIVFARLDGSGGGVFDAPGAEVEDPNGVAIDPAANMILWVNAAGGAEHEGSISWALLDGSAGGQLNTAGAEVSSPYRIAVDPVAGRVYWGNTMGGEPSTIGWASIHNTGGGMLNVSGATPPQPDGFAVDPAANRLYWIGSYGEKEYISYASLSGGNGGDIDVDEVANGPYGLAFDPTIGRFYWGNYSNSTEAEWAIGTADLGGPQGGIDIASTPVAGPQDPVIYKSPIGAGAPAIMHAAHSAALSCSQGTWADYPGSFVYAMPKSYAYQWTLNGAAIAGATASTLTATAAGTYACAVTATNGQGSAAQTSAGVAVNAANLAVGAKKKAKAKPGKAAVFKITLSNGGDLATVPAKLCATLTKKAKKGLKAPKCANVAPIAAGGAGAATLRVKVKKSAKNGAYKLSLALKGAAGNTVKTKVVVKGAKKHGKHHKHRK